jgi:hypothetical protein
MTNVLTEAMLARAEQVCRIARERGAGMPGGYDGGSGISAGLEQGHSAEEKKKWPI